MQRVHFEFTQAAVKNDLILPQAGKLGIEKLPSVLIREIFSYLGLQELVRGCSVSKMMRAALQNDRNQPVWVKALLGKHFFCAKNWANYFGDVGKEPPLPKNIIKILSSPCPFFENKRVHDTHMLILVPKTVEGRQLTLFNLRTLMNNKNLSTFIDYLGSCDCGEKGIEESYWVLMTKDLIPGSTNKTYGEQKKLVNQYERDGYTLPRVLEAAVCMLMNDLVSGKVLFGETYTNCSETGACGEPVVVGGFCRDDAFRVLEGTSVHVTFGVAPVRKLL